MSTKREGIHLVYESSTGVRRSDAWKRLMRWDAIEAKVREVLRTEADGIVDRAEERERIASLVADAVVDL